MEKVKHIVWTSNDALLLLQQKLKNLVKSHTLIEETNYHTTWSSILKFLNTDTNNIKKEIDEIFKWLSIIPWEYELWSIFHTGKISRL